MAKLPLKAAEKKTKSVSAITRAAKQLSDPRDSAWVGKRLPKFQCDGIHPDSEEAMKVGPKDFLGQVSVLFFYPKDMTSGCTVEAQEFSELASTWKRLGVRVLGVSKDSISSHQKFINKMDLKTELLSDESTETLQAFGVWVEKSLYGRKYMGCERSTFVVGADGKVQAVFSKVKPAGHAQQVLEFIKGMRK